MPASSPIATAVIRSEPHITIGALIVRDAALLVERWCERAKAEQPTASRVYHDELRNRLTDFLLAMGRALHQAGDHTPREHRNVALEHGEQRWDSGWSISELVHDYQLLQLVLIEHLATELARPLGHREVMAVGVFINDAIAASIAAYVANRDHHVREIERAGVQALRDTQARKEAFLAMVTHELRNPVAPILNAAEALTLMPGDQEKDRASAVQIIERQARHLARILDDLRDLTRISQGTLTLRRETVDVRDIVVQAVQTVMPLMRDRSHRLHTSVDDQPLLVDGDPVRLVQVVVNLLTNAAKYTPSPGTVQIVVQAAGESVLISVRDTGPGIAPEMIDRVFDMYTRGKDATEQSPDGLGIGLALVKACVELHGGAIIVASGPREGTVFTVTLPRLAS